MGSGMRSFGVENQLLISSGRHLDVRTVCGRSRVAHLDLPLGPGAQQRETAQRVAAAGEERLAQWYIAVGKGLCQADANAVRPHDMVKDGAIVCFLRSQPCKVDAGAQLARIEVEFDRLQGTFMRIQRIVAGVVGEISRNG